MAWIYKLNTVSNTQLERQLKSYQKCLATYKFWFVDLLSISVPCWNEVYRIWYDVHDFFCLGVSYWFWQNCQLEGTWALHFTNKNSALNKKPPLMWANFQSYQHQEIELISQEHDFIFYCFFLPGVVKSLLWKLLLVKSTISVSEMKEIKLLTTGTIKK